MAMSNAEIIEALEQKPLIEIVDLVKEMEEKLGVSAAAAVAAVAAGARVEGLALILSMAMGTALVPIVGQNWGARRFGRVNRTRTILNKTAVVYGLVVFALVLFLADPIGRIFSPEAEVIGNIKWYLWITALGTYNHNRASLKAELTTGGRFNNNEGEVSQDTEYGTVDIEFANCKEGLVEFSFPSAGESGTFNIKRALEEKADLCEALLGD